MKITQYPIDVQGGLDQAAVLQNIAGERARQDAKWGTQRDIPNIVLGNEYLLPAAGVLKHIEKVRAERGESSWVDILLEEVAEAVDEAKVGDLNALRAELVQVAAVAVCWIENIDSRRRG